MITYDSGAKRSDTKPFYKIIPYEFIRRLGMTLAEGAIKYDEAVDESNWKKGDKKFFAECFDHAIEHMYLYLDGDRTEDHLAHAAANLCFLVWAQERAIWDPHYGDYPPVEVPYFEEVIPEEESKVEPEVEEEITVAPTEAEPPSWLLTTLAKIKKTGTGHITS